ncbi:hypothetical protein BDW74DRAFT_150056 [Aspergillus multicolor]|uniref:uncharacterized protein n=1 Tax=Aspergillus multicolor TaxID=41759 RepID=UPI003CCCDAFD
MSLNLLTNPSFESGSLAPWIPSAPNVATVVASNADYTPYDGDYYLSLRTAVGNRGNTISQSLHNLTPGTNYTVSLATRIPAPNGANYCSVSAYGGFNATTGAIVSLFDVPDEWVSLEGWYVSKTAEDRINFVASCTFSGSSYTGVVLFDEVYFGDV